MRIVRLCYYFVLFLLAVIEVHTGWAQTDIASMIGDPVHAHTLPVRFGLINLDNGNLHLEIPLYSVPERGEAPVTNTLVYDSTFWNTAALSGGLSMEYPTNSGWGGGGLTTGLAGSTSWTTSTLPCTGGYQASGVVYVYTNYLFTSSNNTLHQFSPASGQPPKTVWADCFNQQGILDPDPSSDGNDQNLPETASAYAIDGSGYFISIGKYGLPTIFYPDGSTSNTPINPYGETPNGNYFRIDNDKTGAVYDELGAALLPNNPQTCPTSMAAFIQNDSAYLADQPYTPKSSITCTVTVPAWDGSTNSAGQAEYTYTWEYIPVSTGTAATNYQGGMWTLESLMLPDGSQYQFGYDSGTTPLHCGRLTSITLPTGGTVTYGYAPCTGSVLNTAATSVTDNGGTTGVQYSAPNTYGYYYPITVNYPPHVINQQTEATTQDQTIYTYDFPTGTFTQQDYSGSSTIIRTIVTNIDSHGRPNSVSTTWNQTGRNQTSTYEYADNPNLPGYSSALTGTNLIGQKQVYDSGALVKTIKVQYLKDTNSIPYQSVYRMTNYPSQIQVLDGSGNPVTQTQYSYDEYSASFCQSSVPAGMSGIPMLNSVTGAYGHDDARDTSYIARGNVTTITQLASGGSSVVTHKCYDTLGNVTQAIDGRLYATRYSYNDTYFEHACIPSTVTTNAFPTVVTDALGNQTKTTYYSCIRVPEATQGPNDIAAGTSAATTTTYDVSSRPLCTKYPDGGQSCLTYPNANSIQTTVLLNSQGTSDQLTSTLDGFGRTIKQVDTNAGTEVDTPYDSFNRKNCITNPFSTLGSPSAQTCFTYDPFGRTATIFNNADNTLKSFVYTGNVVEVYDETGRHWEQTYDALNRLVQVMEPDASNQTTIETDYQYNALDALVRTDQYGGPKNSTSDHVRMFAYDGLSRLIASSNPENASAASPPALTCTGASGTWTTCYVYDGNGNISSKTDNRKIVTSYSYDHLNHLISKTYTNDPSNTPATCYQYGAPGSGAGNVIERLVNEWTQSAASCPATLPSTGILTSRSILGYDLMGRIANERQCNVKDCTTTPIPQLWYGYDLAGNQSCLINSVGSSQNLSVTSGTSNCPTVSSGLQLTTGFDSAAHMNSVTSNWSTYPTNLYTLGSYSPSGPTSWTLGSNLSVTQSYTNRLWVNGITATGQMPSN